MKNKIYICGDSISVPDNDYKNHHWSEQLAYHLPDYKIKNLAFVGATNFAISAQIEKAITDPDLKLMIINGADIYRFNTTNAFYDKTISETYVPTEKFYYNGVQKLAEKLYIESYKNPLVEPEKLVDLMMQDMHIIDGKRPDPRKILGHFGVWMLNGDKIFLDAQEKLSPQTMTAAIEYIENIFNLNQKFYEDLAILEGKLYKLKSKQIPFLYNLGGLTNKSSYFYDLYVEIIDTIDRNPDFKKEYLELNLYNLGEDFRKMVNSAPTFHISDIKTHTKISDYYLKRIKETI
ncbi:hypothetical protein UFOVP257_104 [uncultured Caudovirales phage]|uniref:Uncharacterized protein n=1 Tax=uncultured Caudovirales phage TaxID=2100421 RepID=A0A6J5LIY4_9CAUD|nr:hypothetical protein UFOVP257_104 [uncultured Caudovirales phage]